MTKLERKFRRRIGMDEIDDALPGGFLLIGPQAGATRRDPGVAADTNHLGENQARAADRTRPVMHQVKIGRHTLFGRIHAHRRDHRTIGDLHLTQPHRLEHRHQRLLHVDI
jgi:hypothetical protein